MLSEYAKHLIKTWKRILDLTKLSANNEAILAVPSTSNYQTNHNTDTSSFSHYDKLENLSSRVKNLKNIVPSNSIGKLNLFAFLDRMDKNENALLYIGNNKRKCGQNYIHFVKLSWR